MGVYYVLSIKINKCQVVTNQLEESTLAIKVKVKLKVNSNVHQSTGAIQHTKGNKQQRISIMSSLKPQVQCVFHEETSTCTYIVQDPSSKHACIIDPVMDFDPAAVRNSQKHNEAVASYSTVL